MTVNNLLFSLISSEISEGKIKPKYDKKPDEAAVSKLYQTSKAHDVAHIVCNVEEYCGDSQLSTLNSQHSTSRG